MTAKASGDVAGSELRRRGGRDLHRRRRLRQLQGHELRAQLGAVRIPDQGARAVLEPEQLQPRQSARPQAVARRPHQRGRDRGRRDQHDPRLRQASTRRSSPTRSSRRSARAPPVAPARVSYNSFRARFLSSTRSPRRSRTPPSTSTRGSTTTCSASWTSTWTSRPASGNEVTINLDLNLSDVNKPQTISTPSSSQPLDNLLRQVAPLLGGLSAQAGGGTWASRRRLRAAPTRPPSSASRTRPRRPRSRPAPRSSGRLSHARGQSGAAAASGHRQPVGLPGWKRDPPRAGCRGSTAASSSAPRASPTC